MLPLLLCGAPFAAGVALLLLLFVLLFVQPATACAGFVVCAVGAAGFLCYSRCSVSAASAASAALLLFVLVAVFFLVCAAFAAAFAAAFVAAAFAAAFFCCFWAADR